MGIRLVLAESERKEFYSASAVENCARHWDLETKQQSQPVPSPNMALFSKRLEALAELAIAEVIRLDEQDAPYILMLRLLTLFHLVWDLPHLSVFLFPLHPLWLFISPKVHKTELI
jgi:hypothetical protein